jgi:RNA chaperone Hfq
MNESCSEQKSFLGRLIDRQASVNVFLINGIRLSGTIQSFDQHVVLLGSPSGVQTVFKHAVATIQTSEHRPPKAAVRAGTTTRLYPRRNSAAS